jgi:3-deoxy-manno-octulosonate cytidylyltransferase (CMP-KDO synthetase)
MSRARRPIKHVPEEHSVIGVIPARYGSTRFPGKPLALISGKPMIQHVYERTAQAQLLDEVVVATDDGRIKDAVEGFGGKAVMTSGKHPSGTDRVAEVAGRMESPYYVNVQGDEPLIDPVYVDTCARLLLEGNPMSTLAARIRWRHELFDQNIAKVVLDNRGYALYFSRSAIPFPRKYLDRGKDVDLDSSVYLRHVGVYGYAADTLRRLTTEKESGAEDLEGLEMLRALDLGMAIRVGLVDSATVHVDVPEDLAMVEKALKTRDSA